MEDNYPKAYKEVLEVLKYVPDEDVAEIPQDLLDTFRENMDVNYEFAIDVEKPFEDQNLLEETKAIFANIFRDYWATEYQRERIIAKEKQDRMKIEEVKREKYNPNDLFKNKRKINEEQEEIQQEEISNNLPIEVKKQNIFQRLIGFIKGFLHIE